MKRQVPVFRLIMRNDASYEDIKEIPEIKKILMEELINAVKDGIKKRRANISLFEINDSSYIISMNKKEWKPSLQTALKYYEQQEEYYKCSEVKKLIDSL